jgi:hypothetical protein
LKHPIVNIGRRKHGPVPNYFVKGSRIAIIPQRLKLSKKIKITPQK